MDKLTEALNKIELILEERFSKEGKKYCVGSFKLNNGNDVKVYLNIAVLGNEVIFELVDKNLAYIHLTTASHNLHSNKVDSIIKKVEKMISHIGNILKYIESIMNVANARFKTTSIDGSISGDRIGIVAQSKKKIRIGISGDFTTDTDAFEFETDSLIDKKNIGFFVILSSEIKKITSQSDLRKACMPFFKFGPQGHRITPVFQFYY